MDELISSVTYLEEKEKVIGAHICTQNHESNQIWNIS